MLLLPRPHMARTIPRSCKRPGRELCAKCHTGEGFEARHVHAPVEDGCLGCHEAHGGPEPALLVLPSEALCATCHVGTDGFSSGHEGLSVAGSDCGSCHPPHAAASPGLLRASVHPALDCLDCHDSGRPAEAPDGAAELCVTCHEQPEGGRRKLAHAGGGG